MAISRPIKPRLRRGRSKAVEPCPTAAGTMVAHCCDGLTACNDVDAAMAADTADERRYQRLAAEQPEEGGDETLH